MLFITCHHKGITLSSGEDRQLRPPHSRDLTGPASKGNQASLVCHFQVPGREVNGPAQYLDWFQKPGLLPGFISRGHGGMDSGRIKMAWRPTLWRGGALLIEEGQGLQSCPYKSTTIYLFCTSGIQREAVCSCCFLPT